MKMGVFNELVDAIVGDEGLFFNSIVDCPVRGQLLWERKVWKPCQSGGHCQIGDEDGVGIDAVDQMEGLKTTD